MVKFRLLAIGSMYFNLENSGVKLSSATSEEITDAEVKCPSIASNIK